MLDIEVVDEPDADAALDIVSVAQMKRHLRITHTQLDDVIEDAIRDAVEVFDFRDGVLNRTVLPRTIRRYLRDYPAGDCSEKRAILLPYPPVVDVVSVTTMDGAVVVDPGTYKVTGDLVPRVIPNDYWPEIDSGTRAVAIEYQAGYVTPPRSLIRMVKILAAHFIENPEATINEPRQMMINRKVEFGIDFDLARLRIPVSYDDWEA